MRRWLAFLLAVVAGCGSAAAQPPAIEYGRDVCVDCGMIIEEPRFASAYRLPDGEERLFDEISDMVMYADGAGEMGSLTAWVHDYDTEEWVPAPDATYVIGSIPTPMGGGIVAFTTRHRAEAFAEEVEGQVHTWKDLVQLVSEGGLQPVHTPMTLEEGHP